MSFWLSHVPDGTLRRVLVDGAATRSPRAGAAYLIDSAHDPTSTAVDHVLPDADAGIVTRKLDDGREYPDRQGVLGAPRALAASARTHWAGTAQHRADAALFHPRRRARYRVERVRGVAPDFDSLVRRWSRRRASAARGPCPSRGRASSSARHLVPPDRAPLALLVDDLRLFLQQLANETSCARKRSGGRAAFGMAWRPEGCVRWTSTSFYHPRSRDRACVRCGKRTAGIRARRCTAACGCSALRPISFGRRMSPVKQMRRPAGEALFQRVAELRIERGQRFLRRQAARHTADWRATCPRLPARRASARRRARR